MKPSFTLHVRNALEAIAPASEAAEVWLEQQGLPSDARFVVSLALEEILTNCIKHGYDDTEEHSIEIVLSLAGNVLSMLVVDDGRAFDASQAPPPDLSLPLEHRPIGGVGIHLLRQITDGMRYERRGGKNRLTLTKRIT